jgi:hypothetical protein
MEQQVQLVVVEEEAGVQMLQVEQPPQLDLQHLA